MTYFERTDSVSVITIALMNPYHKGIHYRGALCGMGVYRLEMPPEHRLNLAKDHQPAMTIAVILTIQHRLAIG